MTALSNRTIETSDGDGTDEPDLRGESSDEMSREDRLPAGAG